MKKFGLAVALAITLSTCGVLLASGLQRAVDAGEDAVLIGSSAWSDRNAAVADKSAALVTKDQIGSAKLECQTEMLAANVAQAIIDDHITSIENEEAAGDGIISQYEVEYSAGISDYNLGDDDYDGAEWSWEYCMGIPNYDAAINCAEDAAAHYTDASGHFLTAQTKANSAAVRYGIALERCQNWECYCQ